MDYCDAGSHHLLNALQFPIGVEITVALCLPSDLVATLTSETKTHFGAIFQRHTVLQIGIQSMVVRTWINAWRCFSLWVDEIDVFRTSLTSFGSERFLNWSSITSLIVTRDHTTLNYRTPNEPRLNAVISSHVWTDLFRYLTSLEVLMINVPLEDMLSALRPEASSERDLSTHPKRMFCPRLRTMYLENEDEAGKATNASRFTVKAQKLIKERMSWRAAHDLGIPQG